MDDDDKPTTSVISSGTGSMNDNIEEILRRMHDDGGNMSTMSSTWAGPKGKCNHPVLTVVAMDDAALVLLNYLTELGFGLASGQDNVQVGEA